MVQYNEAVKTPIYIYWAIGECRPAITMRNWRSPTPEKEFLHLALKEKQEHQIARLIFAFSCGRSVDYCQLHMHLSVANSAGIVDAASKATIVLGS